MIIMYLLYHFARFEFVLAVAAVEEEELLHW